MKILVCSVHFGPGHTAHLNAYSKMLKECGFESALYVDRRYMKLFNDIDGKCIFNLQEALDFKPDILWIWNTGFENMNVIKAFKKIPTKIVYVLHEPYTGISEILKEGSSIIRASVAMLVNQWICSHSDHVIVSSLYAQQNCRKYMNGSYRKSTLFPLVFADEMVEGLDRKYFSSIGAYATAHGTKYFFDFIKDSSDRNNILFQVVTRSNITEQLKDPILQKMMKSGRLIVKQGRPLTEQEMNEAYRKSICTWNGYIRSTQSGVLANSFMQGTPVMATHLGSFDEYVQDGKNGVFIDDFSYDSIFNAFQRVKGNMDEMVENARNTFLTYFYYRNQEEKFKEIVGKLVR